MNKESEMLTVQNFIDALEKIEDKEIPIVVLSSAWEGALVSPGLSHIKVVDYKKVPGPSKTDFISPTKDQYSCVMCITSS